MLTLLLITLIVGPCVLATLFLDEGETCGPSNEWTCLNITKCPSAKSSLLAGRHPQLCGVMLGTPIVCCQPEIQPKTTNLTSLPWSKPISLSEGDACGPLNKWTCRKFSECETAVEDLEEGEDSTTCSYIDDMVVVCCRPTINSQLSSIEPQRISVSKTMCTKYAKYVFGRQVTRDERGKPTVTQVDKCTLNKVESKIAVGGEHTVQQQFPHIARIGQIYTKKNVWFCSGSLISEQWVLTAAHCIGSVELGNATHVRLGEFDKTIDGSGTVPEIFDIELIIVHPEWNPDDSNYNDIALIKLTASVELTPYIRPVCLHGENNVGPLSALASGWGTENVAKEATWKLQKTSLTMLNGAACNNTFGIRERLPQGILEDRMLCTERRRLNGTCKSDAGGPLQILSTEHYCMHSQIGVKSFGANCGFYVPTVFSKVAYYLPWIEKIVWPDPEQAKP